MILKNARHELFAQAVASGKSPSEAYVLADFKPSSANASRLLNRDSVRQRVNEIQAAMAARAVKAVNYGREWVLQELVDNVAKAKQAGEYSAANAALRLLGIERQMFVERKESGAPGDFAGLTTVDEILAKAKQELGEEAANALRAILGREEQAQLDELGKPDSASLN
jgi:hypothetical protein